MFDLLKHGFQGPIIASLLSISMVGCHDDTNDHAASSTDDDTGHSQDESDDTSTDGKEPVPKRLVRGLDLVAIDIFQSTRIPLMADGERLPDDIPLIQGKEALLRLYITTQEQWVAREILVEVTVSFDDRPATVLQDTFFVDGDSHPNELDSSLNIPLAPGLVAEGMSISVALFDAGRQAWEGSDDNARWPTDAPTPLPVDHPDGDLRILIIPIQYNGDNSGRLPELSEDQLALYENLFLASYPITNVVFEFADPMIWNDPIDPTDEPAWQNLLTAIYDWRNNENVDTKLYVYGLFAPTETYGEYCSDDCFKGLSHTPFEPQYDWLRVGVGLGYSGESSAWTMVHEIGHNHGRFHAPAGSPPADSMDDNYPVAGGYLDDWGFDRRSQELLSPSNTYDFMSYASNIWVSGYTYKALLDWSKELNTLLPRIIGATVKPWASVVLLSDGTAQPGPTFDLSLEPQSEQTMTIELIDAGGQVVGTQPGMHYPNGHGGGLVLFAEPPESIDAVRVAENSDPHIRISL